MQQKDSSVLLWFKEVTPKLQRQMDHTCWAPSKLKMSLVANQMYSLIPSIIINRCPWTPTPPSIFKASLLLFFSVISIYNRGQFNRTTMDNVLCNKIYIFHRKKSLSSLLKQISTHKLDQSGCHVWKDILEEINIYKRSIFAAKISTSLSDVAENSWRAQLSVSSDLKCFFETLTLQPSWLSVNSQGVCIWQVRSWRLAN